MTNAKKKWITGVAGLAGIAVLGMPVLNGFILESRINNDLINLVEQNDYAVESLLVNRGYGKTELELVLEGTGLRKINGQALELSGTINHGSILSAPGRISGDLDVNYYAYEQGVRFAYAGNHQWFYESWWFCKGQSDDRRHRTTTGSSRRDDPEG